MLDQAIDELTFCSHAANKHDSKHKSYMHVEYCGLDFCVPRLAVICMDDPEPNVSSM